MHYSRNTFTPAWLLSLILLAPAPSARASGTWDKCPQSVSITPDQSASNNSGIPRSALDKLAPAVLVTGVTYDFGAACPVPEPIQDHHAQRPGLHKRQGLSVRDGMPPMPVDVRFYQENISADNLQKQIVLLPFRAAQRSVIITPTAAGSRGRFVPVKFVEMALAKTHEQKIVASVSIGKEKALATFVLISADFYRHELEKLGHRRHARHHRRASRGAARTRDRS